MAEYERRIRAAQLVRIDAGGTTYTSSLRQFHGKRGIALERLRSGDWVVKIAKGELIIPRRNLIAI